MPLQLLTVKPWFAALSINIALLVQRGATRKWGVDQRLLDETLRIGKERMFLETERN